MINSTASPAPASPTTTSTNTNAMYTPTFQGSNSAMVNSTITTTPPPPPASAAVIAVSETIWLQSGYRPDENVVIIGRGKQVAAHAGNRRFQALVQDELHEYLTAPGKTEKTYIVSRVLQQVREWTVSSMAAADSGQKLIGFVKFCPQKKRWFAPKDSVARITVAQAFRDALSGRYRSSKDSKQRKRLEELERAGTASTASSSGDDASSSSITSTKSSDLFSKTIHQVQVQAQAQGYGQAQAQGKDQLVNNQVLNNMMGGSAFERLASIRQGIVANRQQLRRTLVSNNNGNGNGNHSAPFGTSVAGAQGVMAMSGTTMQWMMNPAMAASTPRDNWFQGNQQQLPGSHFSSLRGCNSKRSLTERLYPNMNMSSLTCMPDVQDSRNELDESATWNTTDLDLFEPTPLREEEDKLPASFSCAPSSLLASTWTCAASASNSTDIAPAAFPTLPPMAESFLQYHAHTMNKHHFNNTNGVDESFHTNDNDDAFWASEQTSSFFLQQEPATAAL